MSHKDNITNLKRFINYVFNSLEDSNFYLEVSDTGKMYLTYDHLAINNGVFARNTVRVVVDMSTFGLKDFELDFSTLTIEEVMEVTESSIDNEYVPKLKLVIIPYRCSTNLPVLNFYEVLITTVDSGTKNIKFNLTLKRDNK